MVATLDPTASAATGAQTTPESIPAARKASRVAVLPITGAIDDVTLWSVERRLRSAAEQGFDAVVLEIDTPGGEVGAMLDVCLRIRSEAPANTVAWIRPKAFSAGTFIALACREIFVAPGSVFGDAAPIAAVPGMGIVPLPAAERAKQESPLLDELDASAARRGDDPRLLAAFVDVGREIWLVERASDGARRFADRADLERLGLDPGATAAPSQTQAQSEAGPARRPLPASELPLGPDDRGAWRLVELVDPADRLLVVQSDEAIRWGLASEVVADDDALAARFAAKELVRFPEHWSETLVRLLVSWPARIALIGILIVALVIESLQPGVGLAGGVAAGAFVLLVGAPGLLGLAEWWEILLVLLGIGLVAAEIILIPGTGFAGVAGAICILVGFVASFTGRDPTSAAERSTLITAVTTTVAGAVAGALLIWVASRFLGETRFFRRAVLATDVSGGAAPPPRDGPRFPDVGATGLADSDLRPSGRARFGSDLLDAQSTGEYLARGTPVRVVGRMEATVIVEAVVEAGVDAVFEPGAEGPSEGSRPT